MSNKKKILFYAPHAGIPSMSVIEAKLASVLQNMGHEVSYVSCHRSLRPYCVTMSAHAVHQDSPEKLKNRVCVKCEKSANYLSKRYNLKNYSLMANLTAEDHQTVQKIVSSTAREHYLELQFEGIPVGRKALYEFLLQHKKSDLDFNELEWSHYRMAIESCLKSLIAGTKVINEVKPDLIIAYNTQYGANGVIESFGEKHGIPVYFIHGGLNLSRSLYDLMIAMAPPPENYKRVAAAWPRFANKPLQSEEISEVAGHLKELFKANSVFVYSSPTTSNRPDIRALYGVSPSQSILVATMSSYDERFAAESNLTLAPVTDSIFKNQIEWIQFLVDYVKTKPDLFLLVRVHPREFPNKREKVKSQHAEKLSKIFEKLPENIKVNWPTDNISLYHIAEEASVFLNAWSSTGKEMGALGRPVVLYSKELPFYATDINLTANTKEQYISMIEEGLRKPFDPKRIIEAFRLFNLEFHLSTLNISTMFDKKHLRPKPTFMKKVQGKILRYTTSIFQLKQFASKPPSLTKDQEEDLESLIQTPSKHLVDFRLISPGRSEQEESLALRKELREIFKILYPAGDFAGHDKATSLYQNLKTHLDL